MNEATLVSVFKYIFHDLFIYKEEKSYDEKKMYEELDKITEKTKREALEKIKENPDLTLVEGEYGYLAVRKREKKPILYRFHLVRWCFGFLFTLSLLRYMSNRFRYGVMLHGCRTPHGWCSELHDWFEKYLYKTPVGNYPIRNFFWRLLFEINYRGCPWCTHKIWDYMDDDVAEENEDVIEDGVSYGIEENTYHWTGWKTCPACGYCEFIEQEDL